MTDKVRIKIGATIFHDHRSYSWPDHAGSSRSDMELVMNAKFDVEKMQSGHLKLTRRGFGQHGSNRYGCGAIFVNADGVEP